MHIVLSLGAMYEVIHKGLPSSMLGIVIGLLNDCPLVQKRSKKCKTENVLPLAIVCTQDHWILSEKYLGEPLSNIQNGIAELKSKGNGDCSSFAIHVWDVLQQNQAQVPYLKNWVFGTSLIHTEFPSMLCINGSHNPIFDCEPAIWITQLTRQHDISSTSIGFFKATFVGQSLKNFIFSAFNHWGWVFCMLTRFLMHIKSISYFFILTQRLQRIHVWPKEYAK